jgi:toxin FitB
MFVLDTNVVSELRKGAKAEKSVVAWASGQPSASMFLSVITVLELENGVLAIERRDPVAGAVLRTWLDDHVLAVFAERVLPLDVNVARRCAALHVPNPRAERDAIIAATASVHGMTVVTRNVVDFQPTGVAIINPWNLSGLRPS